MKVFYGKIRVKECPENIAKYGICSYPYDLGESWFDYHTPEEIFRMVHPEFFGSTGMEGKPVAEKIPDGLPF